MVLTIFTAGTSYRTAGTPTSMESPSRALDENMYTSTPEGSSEMWLSIINSC